MKDILRAVAFVFLSMSCATLLAQQTTATGTPPFGSSGGGSFDTVNLGNLNVHFAIPAVHKTGRGIPFSYDIVYESSIWSPVTSGSSTTWQPAGSWGWNSSGTSGYVTNTTSSYYCYGPNGYPIGHVQTLSNWAYHDHWGVTHSFPGQIVSSTCPGVQSVSSFTSTADDGSGLTMNIGVSGQHQIVTREGVGIDTGSSADRVDANGNEITLSSGVYTDTLGTSALTVAGSGSPTSPVTFTYTAPAGGSANYALNYTNLAIKTNFGCSGVGEYTNSSVALPTSLVLPDGTSYAFTYETTPGFSGYVTGRIHSVRLPAGGTITYDYTGANNGIICSDGSTSGLNRTTPDSASPWTYTRSGSAPSWTTTVTTPAGDQTLMYFQSVFDQQQVQQYYETERDVKQGTSTPLQTVLTCYNGSTLPCNTTAITLPISRRTVIAQLPNASGKQSKVDTTYNASGLPTETDEYDFGSLGSAPGSLLRKTTISYAALGNGIVDHPSNVSVYDGAGSLKAQTTYGYDESSLTATSGTPQHVSISGSRGNLTSVHRSTGSTTLNQTFTYYDTGNVNVATDVNGAQTSYTYGACGNSFPTTVTLPTVNIALTRQASWNCSGGVMTSATDENGNITYANYTTDPYFWRPESTKDAAGNVTTLAYSFLANPGAFQVESQLNFNSGASSVDVLTTTDSSGRSKLTQKRQAPGSSNFDSTQTDYDSFGRVWKQYLPFQATAGSTASSFVGTTTSYDALGRPNSITDSGSGAISVTYTYNDVLQSIGPAPAGENPKRKQLEYDGLGRLSSVCEITSGTGSGTCSQTSTQTGYWTQYSFDTLGNLTGVTQNAQGTSQIRSFVFDQLSRMTSETNPENGTTTYTFDSDATCGNSNGDLVKRVDAVGNVTCYHFDALHRLSSVTYPSGSYAGVTPSKYYVYDSATINGTAMANAKNRLVEAYTCASCSPATKITDLGFSYSLRGEITDVYESSPHSGGWYHVGGTYWANGALNQLTTNLSGLPTVTYGADGEGRVSTVGASSGQSPVSSTSYNVASQATDVTLGSGDSDHYQFDPNTGRMTQYKFTIGATPQNVIGNLTWNANGSLGSLGITDPFNATNTQTCTYAHDDVSRISSVNCGSVWSQSFGFDPFGNINKTGSLAFQPTYTTSTNRIATLPGAPNPTYDANGNITAITDGTSHAYTWDAEGTQLGIDSVSATYDALGRMVELNNSGTYTETVYGLGSEKLALMNGQTLQSSFVAIPSGTAVFNASGLSYYRHSDWLGSSRLASTTSRTMYSSSAYAPFGEQYAAAGTSDQNFTGQQQDTASGLYDFLFRRLSQTQGRWISPDPAAQAAVDITSPQRWNRYAYVSNNPLQFTDALGLMLAYCPDCDLGWGGMAGVCYEVSWMGFTSSTCDSGLPTLGGHGGGHAGKGTTTAAQPANNRQSPCDSISVPDRPAGANLASNIKSAERSRWLIFASPRLYWFYQQVRNKGPWDYKQTTTMNDHGSLTQSPYQDFGNFNFGMTGAAAGIELQVLLRGAGWAQQQAGTSSPEWGNWYGSAPYGDDPEDQAQILAGFNYYKYGCYK